MAFKYADSDVYEVKEGEVWRVGRHYFVCQDVTEQGPLQDLIAAADPFLVYSDPPWTTGQAKQYRTLSDLPPPDYEWTAIFRGVIDLAGDAPIYLVGDRYSEDVVRGLLPARQFYERYWLEKFGAPSVRAVMHYSGDVAPPQTDEFRTLHDQRLPLTLYRLAGVPLGATVVDPCAGLGAVARCADRYGCSSICNELSPLRLSAAIRKLELQSGFEPKRIV